MFTRQFSDYACVGDYIECEVDGLTVRAQLEYDSDARPEDHGFNPEDDEEYPGCLESPETKDK
jgi:hypothetical protein